QGGRRAPRDPLVSVARMFAAATIALAVPNGSSMPQPNATPVPAIPLARRPLLGAPAPGPQQALVTPEPGSELTVRLLTVGQGDVFWEKFGHNAIWISDRTRGLDVTFNWGTFDFDQPNFL